MMRLIALLAALLAAAPAWAQNGANDVVCQSGGSSCVRVPVQSSPPTLTRATDWLTQTSAGGLRVQLQDGAGHDVATANPLPVTLGGTLPAFAATPTVNIGTAPAIAAGTNAIGGVFVTPSSASGAGIAPSATSALASSLVLKAAAGNLYGVTVTTSTTPGYLMIFNATSAPVDGAVTPAKCVYIGAAPATTAISWRPGPGAYLGTGITAVFSTTGCFTKTASATAFIDGDVQ